MKIVVTGASGFVGSAVASRLHRQQRHQVLGMTRRPAQMDFPSASVLANPDQSQLCNHLSGSNAVIHCAAIAHQSGTSPALLNEINVNLTLSIARQAWEAGCHRFVFVSSIGVNGSLTSSQPFSETDTPLPNGPYAQSKLDAEIQLRDFSARSGLELVIVRPPLVYAPHAPGNFGALYRWISNDRPLPFGLATLNLRSYIGLDNLASFLITCAEHPCSAGETFLISDGQDISTAELVCQIALALNKPQRLWRVPVACMKLGAHLVGQQGVFDRLLGSLQIDSRKSRKLLGWQPVLSMTQQLRQMSIKLDM
jgi:nucleoside-diphosphate-sugar epimerase